MCSRRNRLAALAGAALAAAACNQASTQAHGLSSFHVTVKDLSGQLGAFPLSPVSIQVNATALDEDGNPYPYSGTAVAFVTPGNTFQAPPNQYQIASEQSQYPTLNFSNGEATGTISAWHVFGDTAVWVQAVTTGTGDYATGISDPDLLYGYPLMAELQVDPINNEDPLEGNYVVIDQTKPRCIVDGGFGSPPPDQEPDAGVCGGEIYYQDLLVTAVTSDGFYAMDLGSYYQNPEAGYLVPQTGFNPQTEVYDLPGSWACMFVYNYDAPNLFLGQRLTTISGTIGEFDGDTQMDYPAWTINSDPQYANPSPNDVPPPVPVDPTWCADSPYGDHLADQYLCASGDTTNMQWESLESCFIIAKNVTMPNRWLDCDVTGTGEIPYRTSSGCMPDTSGAFCGEPGAALAQCPSGQDCVANECVNRCSTKADCVNNLTEQEDCIDGHCQNACLCLEYCNSDLNCSELSQFNSYGQYNGWIPGETYPDGGQHGPWKVGFVTRNGAPELSPQTMPGMVVDIAGMLNQVRAADPMWEIDPRIESDVCCHLGSPFCGPDAGNSVPVCPQPVSGG